MSDWHAYDLHEGTSPLLISMPHSGTRLTAEVKKAMTAQAKLLPDTDWYIPEIYSMATDLGASVLRANYSRYVIDVNRSLDDVPLYSSKTTGLFPDILFADEPVFADQMQPDEAHQAACKQHVWQAYHATLARQLARLKALHGYAILLDAHSIASVVPMLFDGKLPDFNWGTNDGKACPASLLQVATKSVELAPYSQVCNGRFKGGFITRHYGRPSEHVYALQLELGQDTYLADGDQQTYIMDKAKLARLQVIITKLVHGLCAWRPAH